MRNKDNAEYIKELKKDPVKWEEYKKEIIRNVLIYNPNLNLADILDGAVDLMLEDGDKYFKTADEDFWDDLLEGAD